MDTRKTIYTLILTSFSVFQEARVILAVDCILFVETGFGGRRENADTVNIWYLNPDFPVASLTTNRTLHGTIPTLIGDTWGETIFKGPMVVVVKEGNASDPRRIKDVTLTAYRDAVDYLGYYIN